MFKLIKNKKSLFDDGRVRLHIIASKLIVRIFDIGAYTVLRFSWL